uniref:Uncharacterized protein n=1 Tax=Romanomermis culicivorax TaxID=13658 RepID=A0A915IV56_ROMCU
MCSVQAAADHGIPFNLQVSQSLSSDVTNVKTWLPMKIQQGHMGRARFPLEDLEGEISNRTVTMTDDYWSIEDLYYNENCQIPRPDAETIRQFNGLVIGPSDKDIDRVLMRLHTLLFTCVAVGQNMKMQNATVVCVTQDKISMGKMVVTRPMWKDVVIGQNKMIIYGYAESYEFCNKTVVGKFLYVPHRASGLTRSLRVDQCPEHGNNRLSVKDQNNVLLGLRTRFNVMLRSAIRIDPVQSPSPIDDIPMIDATSRISANAALLDEINCNNLKMIEKALVSRASSFHFHDTKRCDIVHENLKTQRTGVLRDNPHRVQTYGSSTSWTRSWAFNVVINA